MGKVFVSYSHRQAEWVRDRLCPALKAGGAEVLIDVTRFRAGIALHQQMDATQDQADVHLLVLSPDYLSSAACVHEMDRAIALDPTFAKCCILPVVRVPCTLLTGIKAPLYVRLDDDSVSDQWDRVMKGCEADLGASVPHWLDCLERVQTRLERRESVNLRVIGSPKWRELLDAVHERFKGKIGHVDLNGGDAVSRRGLVSAILLACGHHAAVSSEPDDLAELQARIGNSAGAMIELRHFDRVKDPDRHYGDAFFWAINHLVETRKLSLLIESRETLAALVPPALKQSSVVSVTKTVELRGN